MAFDRLKKRLHALVETIVEQRLDRLRGEIKCEAFVKDLAQALANTPTVWGDSTRVSVGSNVHLVNALLNVSSGRITIGNNTFFGHNVCLLTGTHPLDKTGAERQSHPLEGRDIVIGEGVWIASNAIVLGPCRIGDNAVVAAGSVVTNAEIEAGSVYAGVPARRKR
ncbi:DapH/DapD/GlmU-related protein [Microvirga sp. 2MCAF35]|uniref:DapH/DapD/GlmU-related protein n=1 Tax=Microvirga sp. 2MCAF35 TaxID=3232987 RepID=UPI003F9A5179